jgi:hypothetical protein
MFDTIKARINRVRNHPEVEELAQNTRQLLNHELRRLNRRIKRRLTNPEIEPLANR